jgi:putrescine transport system ATP-binding protein
MTDSFDRHRSARATSVHGRDPAAKPLVRFEGVSKRFGGVPAVERVDLDIEQGDFFALLGPSGSGKSTLLRMLAGFERPSEGRILLDGEDISHVPPHRRPVNMMFQSYALFPHLSVSGNVAFGLKQDNLSSVEIDERVRDMLKLVQLEGFDERKPHQLSGGQRQRVALARALVKRPRVLLLDEPLSALDRKLREETRFELTELQRGLGLTFIMVTHDQDEAMALSDRIGVMNQGRLVQVATPSEIYEQPISRWVAGFVGDVNLIEGQFAEAGPAGSVVECKAGGRLRLAQNIDAPSGALLWVAVRPEKIQVTKTQISEPQFTKDAARLGENAFAGVVADIGYLGDTSVFKVKLDNGLVLKAAAVNRTRSVEQLIRRDDRVWLSWPDDVGVVLTQ